MGLPFVIIEGVVLIVGPNGNVADVVTAGGQNRLAVTSQPALPSDTRVKYASPKFLNVASSDMTVDGSGTPVDFNTAPSGSEIRFIEYVRINMRDDGNLRLDEFGSGPALANGLRVRIQSGGTLINDFLVKTNEDLINASDDVTTLEQFTGAPLILFTIRFPKNISIFGGSSDFMRMTVQDDLTNIGSLSASARHWEAVV